MQESLAEATLAEVPLVIFNMARSQGDYFQATRGGGHGDYRTLVLAPQDVREGVELTQLAFHLADKWRNPVLVYGDYLLAHTQEAVAIEPASLPPLPAKDWAVDGARTGTGQSATVTSLGLGKVGQRNFGQEGKAQYIATKMPLMEREVRVETGYLDDAETVVVAFGTPARFVKYAIGLLRDAGHRVGFVRPITLWPFPYDAVRAAAASAGALGTFELSSGQLVDDVLIGAAGLAPVDHARRRVDRPLRLRRRQDPRRRRRDRSHPRVARGASTGAGAGLRRVQLHARSAPRGGCTVTAPRSLGPVLDASTPPASGARLVEAHKPDLLLTEDHSLCPGCGEPLAVRVFLDAIAELGLASSAVAVAGIGCYTMFSGTMDVDLVQALHGRAPSVATGVKRMLPDTLVFTLQGRRRHGQRGAAGGAPHRRTG